MVSMNHRAFLVPQTFPRSDIYDTFCLVDILNYFVALLFV